MSGMSRRDAIAKATITRTTAEGGLLPPGVSKKFLHVIKDKGVFGKEIRQELKGEPTGNINKITSGRRLIRPATENSDDGYRAEVQFPTTPYAANKMRLPWEVTEDTYHENLEGQSLEQSITDEMTEQFALDLDDLNINGDSAAEGEDEAFLRIDNGLLKLAASAEGIHRVDGSTINEGALEKGHFFAMAYAMPDKFLNTGRNKWFMSPKRRINWIEAMTDRETAAGDAAIGGGPQFDAPLGTDIIGVPQFPDDRIIMTDPKNLVRVVTWDVRKRKVTGETDWELATRDKRGYIFFLKADFIIAENAAVVDLHTLDPIT